jgi:hypothetical protein
MTAAKGMLTAAISAQQNQLGRAEHDYYPTPVDVTRALLPEISDFPSPIWEPACGDGAIARELERGGFTVIGTDIAHQSYGEGGIDFLTQKTRRADAIVTNPPFGKLASRFIEHALALEVPYMAMLLNVNFWHAKARTALFNRRRPDAILPLTWRPDFTGSARPYFNCIWTVWRPGAGEHPIYRRLVRPTEPEMELPLVDDIEIAP